MAKQAASVALATTRSRRTLKGNQRLGRGRETGHEGGGAQQAEPQQPEHRSGGPGIAHAAPAQAQHQAGRADDEERGAGIIDAVAPLAAGQQLQLVVGEEEGGEADRQVDPEDRRPVQVLGEEAAEQGPGQRGHGETRPRCRPDSAPAPWPSGCRPGSSATARSTRRRRRPAARGRAPARSCSAPARRGASRG